MSETRIIRCSCKNKFQDERYGKDKRVFNRTLNGGNGGWRCTVCKKEKSLGEAPGGSVDYERTF